MTNTLTKNGKYVVVVKGIRRLPNPFEECAPDENPLSKEETLTEASDSSVKYIPKGRRPKVNDASLRNTSSIVVPSTTRVSFGNSSNKSFKPSSTAPIKNEFSIPKYLIELVDAGELTEETLKDIEYTDALRLATYKPAAKFIHDTLGVRGVYILNKHLSSDGRYKDTIIKPYQVETLEWMRNREKMPPNKTFGIKGGILSLHMGLGKTLTALVHVLSSDKGKFPTLIICSKTVLINWHKDGIAKFFGKGKNAPKVLFLHKDFIPAKEIKSINRETILKYDIVVTSYDVCGTACKNGEYYKDCEEIGDPTTLMKDKIVSIHERSYEKADNDRLTGIDVIYGTPWHRVICDESQKFANPTTQLYKNMMAIYGDYKWCLTGTPIRNYDTDIWAQLRFCGYTGITRTIEWKKKGPIIFVEHKLIDVIFKMDYDNAGEKMPPKTKHLITVTLKEGFEMQMYRFVLAKVQEVYDKMMQKLLSFTCVLSWFTRLRQCVIAPYLMLAESKREKSKGVKAKVENQVITELDALMKMKENTKLNKWCSDKNGEAGIRSTKMTQIITTISKIPKNEKVIIFSSFTSCLDLLAHALDTLMPDFLYVQIDGVTKGPERKILLDKFTSDPTIRGAMFTYKVGGEGLNLTVATHCICIEPWWTPAVQDQAEARCWRIGQTKNVHIHNIIVESTIEEKIIEICNAKEIMAASYLEGTTKTGKMPGLDKYSLGKLIGLM